ncbi:lytic transglycosylase domain-containing protein [Acidisoma silvae]|uniref:Lytic transglycosylase domain-containing protein n=1 Tax=Acidisoma silvae TaxID=2802396 RepID=A0A964DX41_9PROT|nr:lytic transglycosylase domain-containing protein [Acidisoma silvae]MCB8873766.1 lytic transglycosylase domain-containing protein [Acidisoma silvae]
MRLLPLLGCASLLAFHVSTASAQGVQTPMDAVAARNWDQANAMAAQYADPVAVKLVTYYRMLTPGQASAAEIRAFMTGNPDWPQQALLETRWEAALVAEPDQATALAQCQAHMPHGAQALLRCATAFQAASDAADATKAVRAAWTGTGMTDPSDVSAFLSQWGSLLTPEDELPRFVALARIGSPAAAAQISRLPAGQQTMATTWVALNTAQSDAATSLQALPASDQENPGLFLAGARYLRKNAGDPVALQFWQGHGYAAFQAGDAIQQHALWHEAAYLARDLISDNDGQDAYALVKLIQPSAPADAADQQFLAGFIALRVLHNANKAEPFFRNLTTLSAAAITQSRAHYWLGRTLAAEGSTMQAANEYKLAAAYPTTFYGQIAALALGDTPAALNARIMAAPEPAWNANDALGFAGRETARAAAFLVAWNQPRRAYGFLLDVAAIAPDPADYAMAAELAVGFQIPYAGVGLARVAGLHGTMLLNAGWPIPFQPTANAGIEPAVTLGLIRQESSFDVGAVSPAGALGLMQLMPATARLQARQDGTTVSNWQLTSAPDVNMTLGNAYFSGLMARFDNCLPLSIASYNAGPNRVDQWLAQNGDFRTPGGPDVLDWIEMIPFDETRNYVQRVTEGIAIYRAREGVVTPYPLAQWLH